jgi:predicted metalloprotease with PDZ domain
LLRRAGLTTVEEYLEGLAKTMATYDQTPGHKKQSPAAASFDAWIKHYRPNENSINTAMSYYTTGELLSLMLDLEIRTRTNGTKTLDDVMRLLFDQHALPKPGFTDAELKAAFEKIAGADLTDFFHRYVNGTDEPDFNRYLGMAGLQLNRLWQPAPALRRDEKPGWLGIRTRVEAGRVIISNVPGDTPAYTGGVNANDELVALNHQKIEEKNVSERLSALRAGDQVTVTVFRREKLLSFTLTAALRPPDLYRITRMKEMNTAQRALYEAWLREEIKS